MVCRQVRDAGEETRCAAKGAGYKNENMPGRLSNPILCSFASFAGMALLVGCKTPEPTTADAFGAATSYLQPGAHLTNGVPATAPPPEDVAAAPASTERSAEAPEGPAAPEPPANRESVGGPSTHTGLVGSVPNEAAVADAELRQVEQDLRQELSVASDPTDCALELAGLLADLERHREALAVLTTARQRSANQSLRVAIAGVHRDLGQRHLAVAALEAVLIEEGSLAMSPALQLELAELQWLEGSPAAALATTSGLRRAHADGPWFAQHAAAVQALELEVGTQAAPTKVRVRDLLGNLRGAPGPLVRLRTLEELLKLADGLPTSRRSGGMSIVDRTLAIGLADEAGVVRARAIQLGAPRVAEPELLFRAALRDADPMVRTVTAAASAERLQTAALPQLIEAIAAEQDPKVFRAIHEAASSIASGGPTLAPDDELHAERRAALAVAWTHR